MKNLWIITEERPKVSVISQIIQRFADDRKLSLSLKKVKILPIMKNGKFTFTYEVIGVTCEQVKRTLIKIASGNSSFVDFLVFYEEPEPTPSSSIPLYAIEETKTSDAESRNTGVYQRCSKFVFVEFYYPGIKKIMFYNYQIPNTKKPSATSIFGTRLLLTIGVEIMGRTLDQAMKPFESLDELISAKNSMRLPPKTNVPIKIKPHPEKITISGTLFKKDALAHDPNIGAITIIALCLRKWEKKKDIIVVLHGLAQKHIGKTNKFIRIANKIGIKLDGLVIPEVEDLKDYWHYENQKEKLASIFTHLIISAYTKGKIIYENHGGSERGYFIDAKEQLITVGKYQEGKREEYKKGNKDLIIYIPDLVIFDQARREVIDCEGKKYVTRRNGIKELNNYDYFDEYLVKKYYSPRIIKRTVIVFGSKLKTISEKEVGLMLTEEGVVIVNKTAPNIIKEAVSKLP